MPIKALVVDDSVFVRKLLRDILNSDPEIDVIGTASDPYEAREIIAKEKPDVITLDIEMPKMDGITFLKKLQRHFPIPTVMISSLSKAGSDMAIKALEAGAADVMEKPKITKLAAIEEVGYIIIEKVKGAAKAKNLRKFKFKEVEQKRTTRTVKKEFSDKIVAIGASTGGPEAVYNVISKLPENFPGTLVVIHMPAGFTKSYSDRLNKSCKMEVKEAQDGDKLYKGRVLIAPGDYQMYLKKSGMEYYVSVKPDPIYNHHRPAVDPMFESVASVAGKKAVGVILTGMGGDGAEGMLSMKKSGSYNVAQTEETCVVFGMPKVAIKKGGVDKIVDLEKIPADIINYVFK